MEVAKVCRLSKRLAVFNGSTVLQGLCIWLYGKVLQGVFLGFVGIFRRQSSFGYLGRLGSGFRV